LLTEPFAISRRSSAIKIGFIGFHVAACFCLLLTFANESESESMNDIPRLLSIKLNIARQTSEIMKHFLARNLRSTRKKAFVEVGQRRSSERTKGKHISAFTTTVVYLACLLAFNRTVMP